MNGENEIEIYLLTQANSPSQVYKIKYPHKKYICRQSVNALESYMKLRVYD